MSFEAYSSGPQRLWANIDQNSEGVKAYDKVFLDGEKGILASIKRAWVNATSYKMPGPSGGETYLVNKRSLQKFMERNKPSTQEGLFLPKITTPNKQEILKNIANNYNYKLINKLHEALSLIPIENEKLTEAALKKLYAALSGKKSVPDTIKEEYKGFFNKNAGKSEIHTLTLRLLDDVGIARNKEQCQSAIKLYFESTDMYFSSKKIVNAINALKHNAGASRETLQESLKKIAISLSKEKLDELASKWTELQSLNETEGNVERQKLLLQLSEFPEFLKPIFE